MLHTLHPSSAFRLGSSSTTSYRRRVGPRWLCGTGAGAVFVRPVLPLLEVYIAIIEDLRWTFLCAVGGLAYP
jgi:hypothetical protein